MFVLLANFSHQPMRPQRQIEPPPASMELKTAKETSLTKSQLTPLPWILLLEKEGSVKCGKFVKRQPAKCTL